MARSQRYQFNMAPVLAGAALIISGVAYAETPKVTPTGGNRWTLSQSKDPLDGKEAVSIREPAFDVILYPQRRPEIRNSPATFVIGCNKGRSEAYFDFGNSLVASHITNISYRVDERPPVKDQRWQASDDSTSLGLWTNKSVPSFVKGLLDAKKIFVRIQHNVFGVSEATFNLAEIKSAVVPIRAACKW